MLEALTANLTRVAAEARDALGALRGYDPASAFRAYARQFSPPWMAAGAFTDTVADVVVKGPQDYIFHPPVAPALPFSFRRANGEVVTPGPMRTDGGSVPRLFWSLPGIDPWTYLPAYLLHDWMFLCHHCRPEMGFTFESANATLAEAIYTLMQTGYAKRNLADVVVIHAAVNSPFGRAVWDRAYSPEMCAAALNP